MESGIKPLLSNLEIADWIEPKPITGQEGENMKTNLLDTTAQASKPDRPKESELILEELGALEIEPLPEDLGNDETEIEILESDNLGILRQSKIGLMCFIGYSQTF